MSNGHKGFEVQFLNTNSKSSLTKEKNYRIEKIEKFRRNKQEFFYLTILDDNKKSFRFKASKDVIVRKINKLWIELEYEIIDNIWVCLMHKEECENELQKQLKKFQNISKTSNQINFRNFIMLVNDKNYNENKCLDSLKILREYLENEAEKIGILLGDRLYDQKEKFKTEVDTTDYERIIMASFRDGEQDRFGY